LQLLGLFCCLGWSHLNRAVHHQGQKQHGKVEHRCSSNHWTTFLGSAQLLLICISTAPPDCLAERHGSPC
jgi:hypothetical protein